MQKKKAVRLAGFVGALCATGALVSISASSTGAYFTDSHPGNLQGSSGHLKLNVSDSALNLNFSNLVPGVDQSSTVSYSVDTNTPEDIWMVFDQTSTNYGAFSGARGSTQPYPDGGLGGYGHFAVGANGGTAFESYNLALDPSNPSGLSQTASTSDCGVDAYGDGGSTQKTVTKGELIPYCGVPGMILLASNVPDTATGSIKVTFGITNKWTAQNSPAVNVPYTIVATQHGILPNDPFNK